MSSNGPNTKFAPVPMPVPRDPVEYRVTSHFRQRLRDRVPKHLHDRVVRECIEQGKVRGASPPDRVTSDDEMVQAFAFDQEVGGDSWTLVVGIMRDAYLRDESKHKAITIYPAEGGDD